MKNKNIFFLVMIALTTSLIMRPQIHEESKPAETTKSLWKALDKVDLQAARSALEAGADPNAPNSNFPYNNTALCQALENNQIGMVRLMIKHGADINKRDKWGNPPMVSAAYYGHIECIKTLIENGADVNAQSNEGTSVFMTMLRGKHPNHYQATELFLAAGADVHWSNVRGGGLESALTGAIDDASAKTVGLLIKHGARFPYKNICADVKPHIWPSDKLCRSAEFLKKAIDENELTVVRYFLTLDLSHASYDQSNTLFSYAQQHGTRQMIDLISTLEKKMTLMRQLEELRKHVAPENLAHYLKKIT